MKFGLQYKHQSNLKVLAKHFANGFLISFAIILIALLGFYNSHSYYKIIGASMEPGIASSGYSCYITPKNSYSYGDIIISYDKTKHSNPVIKRIVAKGGDYIGFYLNTTPEQNGFIYAYYQILLIKEGTQQPVLLNEEYLYAGITDTSLQNQKLTNNYYAFQDFSSLISQGTALNLMQIIYKDQLVHLLKIEANHVFILGDNRQISEDSANYGSVPESSIQGKVEYIFESTTPTFLIALKQIFGF